MPNRRDPAHEATDKRLKAMEKKIRREYRRAAKEVQERLDDHFRRFAIKDKTWLEWVVEGKVTEKKYKEWRIGQMAIGERWERLRDQLADVYVNADKAAYAIIHKNVPWIFAENYNFATFEIEKGLRVDTSFLLYSEEAAARLLDENPQMLPPPGKRVSEDIRLGNAKRWNNKSIQSVMMQGIIQGKTISAIARDLSRTVGDKDYKAALRNARTMTTAAENAGRIAGYYRAQDMGIELGQQWLAALDNRTRHQHRELDGQIVEVGKPFIVHSEGEEIRFPGAPEASPHLIYNCRCTVRAALRGIEIDASDLSLRNTNKFDHMSYEAWKEDRKTTSDPIDKQDDIAKRMKSIYTRAYRGEIPWK